MIIESDNSKDSLRHPIKGFILFLQLYEFFPENFLDMFILGLLLKAERPYVLEKFHKSIYVRVQLPAPFPNVSQSDLMEVSRFILPISAYFSVLLFI